MSKALTDSGCASRRTRRRLLWVGLALTVAAAGLWLVRSRRPSELPPLSAPLPPVTLPPAAPISTPPAESAAPDGGPATSGQR